MRTTHRLPLSQWYDYTGDFHLDYPPLAAYLHYFAGHIYRLFDPASFFTIPMTQFGPLTPTIKFAMRSTILILTVILYYPAAIFVVDRCLAGARSAYRLVVLSLLFNMPLLLHIDYVNTQVNALHICIPEVRQNKLGTFLLAFYFARERSFVLSTILACMSMLSKQVVLPLAIPIGFYALAASWQDSKSRGQPKLSVILPILHQ